MRITPAELIHEALQLDLSFAAGAITYAPDVSQAGPLQVIGIAERIEEHRGPRDIVDDIRLRARFQGSFELLCARCLDPIAHHADQRFDLIFKPAGVDAEQGERAISEAETEIGYYEESGLLLEDVVREQVLLSLPDRSLCGEDCKGLCPRCGENLNQAECHCKPETADPRWSALQGFGAAGKTG